MPKRHSPRKSSMQFWPRKRSPRPYSGVKARVSSKTVKPLEFAGYKAGMTHVLIKDSAKNSMTKGMNVSVPVTVIECPAIKIAGLRFYAKKGYGTMVQTEVLNNKVDKELGRKICLAKESEDFSKAIDAVKLDKIVDVKVLVYTEPKKAGFGKKKPEVFEMAVGGDLHSKIKFVKDHAEKGITLADTFKAGEYVDVHGITKGKGFQGSVKRYGVELRSHKAEKTKRAPGSLGPWSGQGHIMYREAYAGKMGYHPRIDYNKQIVLISENADDVNVDGGFINFGLVRGQYLLLKGSVPGPKKRLVRLVASIRLSKKVTTEAPKVVKIVKDSPQGC